MIKNVDKLRHYYVNNPFIFPNLAIQYKLHLMKVTTIVLIVFSTMLQSNSTNAQSTQQANTEHFLYMADPTMYYTHGNYYLYGTYDLDNSKGFRVYTSKDYKRFRDSGTQAFSKGNGYGTAGFWAPQLWQRDGKYYMFYVANEHIALAEATNPTGPFMGKSEPLITSRKTIDPFVFKDSDDKLYLFHVEFDNGNKIFTARLKDDLTGIIPNTDSLCLEAQDSWEMKMDKVIEGPTVLKHKGWYYLIYSANHFKSQDYAVGYAVSKSIYGPWKRAIENPILSKNKTGLPGTGHGDIFSDKNGKMFYVFHTHYSMSVTTPRKTAYTKVYFKRNKKGEPDLLVMDQENVHYIESY